MRVAIPVFRSRISPVFDTAHRCLLVEYRQKEEISKQELTVHGFSASERVDIFSKEGVNLLICGGISGMVQRRMEVAGIKVLSGRAGRVEEILEAQRNGLLGSARFRMPGCPCRRRRVGRRCGRDSKKRDR